MLISDIRGMGERILTVSLTFLIPRKIIKKNESWNIFNNYT
jgi:hypothetical protein